MASDMSTPSFVKFIWQNSFAEFNNIFIVDWNINKDWCIYESEPRLLGTS